MLPSFAGDGVVHTDKVPISELGDPKHHQACLPIPLPGLGHPHRLSLSSGSDRSYNVLVHRYSETGVPQLVMAHNEFFNSWVLSPVPGEATQLIGALARGGSPQKRLSQHLSPVFQTMLGELRSARQDRMEKLRTVRGSEGRIIRFANSKLPELPESLRTKKTAPFSQRSEQIIWLKTHYEAEMDKLLSTHQVQKLALDTHDHDLATFKRQLMDRGMAEVFQGFDPAYQVPREADTVLVWFPGMGTDISQVLTVKTVVHQTLSLMRGTPREGKIWPVGISLPKHGGPNDVESLDDMMKWMDNIVSYYRLLNKKVILAGRSASGTLILEYLSRHPEKLAGAIPFGHVWPDPKVQLDHNLEYLLRGPDKELTDLVHPELLDWTVTLMTACKWHERLKDPEIQKLLPPIMMAHGMLDDEYKAKQPDGSWKSIMPEVTRIFGEWVADIPAIDYQVFDQGWHNLFLVHPANKARHATFNALKTYLNDL